MKPQEEQAMVNAAAEGSKAELEKLVRWIQGDVYNLAVRFLWNTDDAQDATQEILLKTITHLSTFKGESALKTWVYRIAYNYLINAMKSKAEQRSVNFTAFSKYIRADLDQVEYAGADKDILTEEVKLSCSTGLLLCLNREQRLAYLLGEVFEVSSEDGAFITDTNTSNFRKRLSMAREKIRSFIEGHCGLVKAANPCRCQKRINAALQQQRIIVGQLQFVGSASREAVKQQVEQLIDVAALYKSHPHYQPPTQILNAIKSLVASGRFPVLGDLD